MKGINNPFDAVNQFRERELLKNAPMTKRDYFAGIFLGQHLSKISPDVSDEKLMSTCALVSYGLADDFIMAEKNLGKPTPTE